MKTPLLDALKEFDRARYARFFMPGHKGSLAKFDLTETPLTGDLYESEGFFAESERCAAALLGVAEVKYCAGGSSLCVQAMAAAFLRPHSRVAVRRTVHRSVLNAFALLDITPVFADEPADAGKIIAALDGCDGAFITDPDYYGNTLDIAAVAAACRAKNIPLLVDGAHRAHYAAVGLPYAVALGADAECISLHKTLPALTGGAAVLLKNAGKKTEITRRMQLFGSSSPSYLISLSVESAFASLESEREGWRRIVGFCRGMAAENPAVTTGADPARLRIDLSGCADPEATLREYKIAPEFTDPQAVAVLLVSPENTERELEALERLCRNIPEPRPIRAPEPPRAVRVMSPREALERPSERVSLELAAGRIAADPLCPCPPCYAAADRGERISPQIAEFCRAYGICHTFVLL